MASGLTAPSIFVSPAAEDDNDDADADVDDGAADDDDADDADDADDDDDSEFACLDKEPATSLEGRCRIGFLAALAPAALVRFCWELSV